MRQHGVDRTWRLGWDNARRRAGQTRFHDRTITLSKPLMSLYTQAQVRDTILHEIAHALVGPEHNHDSVWRATAQRIGCSGRRQVSPDAPQPPAPWVGRCAAGHEVHRYRRPRAVASCSRCSRTFDPRFVLTWTRRG